MSFTRTDPPMSSTVCTVRVANAVISCVYNHDAHSRRDLQGARRARQSSSQSGMPEPYCIGQDEWACAVALPGLHSKLADQHGVDAFQALMLAQNLAYTLHSILSRAADVCSTFRAGALWT